MGDYFDSSCLTGLMSIFPPNICYAFAYGSAVISQECPSNSIGTDNGVSTNGRLTNGLHASNLHHKKDDEKIEDKMIDLVFVVDDPLTWHTENLQRNPSHYSFLGLFGPKFVTYLQRQMKAKIYFNVVLNVEVPQPDCTSQTRSMKYGVIHTLDLVEDLVKWNNLYVSGRLHKPVQVLIRPTAALTAHSKMLNDAFQRNYRSALYVSLLLLEEEFSEEDLYTTIAGLSYFGDFRMIVGEDKCKVQKIVQPQIAAFRAIYFQMLEPLLCGNSFRFNSQSKTFHNAKSPSLFFTIMQSLPETIYNYLCDNNLNVNDIADEDFKQALKCDTLKASYQEYTKKAVTKVVWISSISQGIKGFFTTGFTKAIRYCFRKLVKMTNSLN